MREFRLYAITGEQFHPGRELATVMEEAILGGVDIIQLETARKAQVLRELTRKHQVPFIVNDHIDIALAVDADGIHLGQDDLPSHEARKLVGNKIIGISTHAIEEARRAEAEGADYIGVGPVFPTKSKVDVVDPVTTAYVREVATEIRLPFVAIGGIKSHNVDEVLSPARGAFAPSAKSSAVRMCAALASNFLRKSIGTKEAEEAWNAL